MKSKSYIFLFLLIIPLILFFVHSYFINTVDNASHPVNTDPDYAYLVSAIDLSKLGISRMVLHPGTTFQLLAHGVMKIAYIFHSQKDINFTGSVLTYPGYYLNWIQSTFAFLNIILIFFIGFYAFRIFNEITAALLIQATPFLSSQLIIFGYRKVSTDILLISTIYLTLFILLFYLRKFYFNPQHESNHFSKDHEETENKKRFWLPQAIGLGVFTGFALATKVTFLPVMIVLVFLLPHTRSRISYLFISGAGLILFTLPISSQYGRILDFITRIFTHKGIYGNGAAAVFDISEFSMNLSRIIIENLPFFLLTIFNVILIGIILIKRKDKTDLFSANSIPVRILIGITISQVFAILLVARHFKSKYLLPVLGFSAITLLLINLIFCSSQNRTDGKKIVGLPQKWLKYMGIIFIIFSFVYTFWGLKKYHSIQEMRLRESIEIGTKLTHEYQGYCVIYYYNASSTIYALEFGNNWTPAYQNNLYRIYGEHYFYNHYNTSIYSWSGKQITIEELKAQYKDKILLYGNTFEALKNKQGTLPPPFPIKDIYEGRYFTLYQIIND